MSSVRTLLALSLIGVRSHRVHTYLALASATAIVPRKVKPRYTSSAIISIAISATIPLVIVGDVETIHWNYSYAR